MNPQNSTIPPEEQNQPTRDLRIPDRSEVRAPQAPERDTAATILHNKIDTIYESNPPNQLKQEPEVTEGGAYDRTYADNKEQFNIQQYHTAWQQYYQQYYHRYYLQQLHLERQQQAAQKAREAATPTVVDLSADQPASITGGDTTQRTSQVNELKTRLLDLVKDRAKQMRGSHHFMPIVTALAIGLIFVFLQYNRVFLAQVKAYVSPGSVVNENDTVLVDPVSNVNVGADPKLIIPKINVNIHVVYDIISLEDAPVQEGLKKGVVHYKLPGANSLPGQIGNTVILGHSSNDIFDPGDYKFAFVLLDRLQPGDVAYMHYEGKRYMYRVTEKKVITPSEFNALQINNGKPMLTLVTCTPPGTALKRLLVYAEQISPDPAAATKPAAETDKEKDPATLPGYAPTLLERIFGLFF